MISFELFGHFHAVIEDVAPVLERTLLETGRLVGFVGGGATDGARRAHEAAHVPSGADRYGQLPDGDGGDDGGGGAAAAAARRDARAVS